MIIGEFKKINDTIQMNHNDARTLGKELIRQACETEDHQSGHVIELYNGTEKFMAFYILLPEKEDITQVLEEAGILANRCGT